MKEMTIGQLLTWAFCEELPKIGGQGDGLPSWAPSTWGAMLEVIALGTMVDKAPNGYGVISVGLDMGAPHADAVAVGDAVRALAALEGFEIGAGWQPFPEWDDPHGLIAAEVASVVAHELGRGGRMNGRHVVNLVTSAAILRRGPDWEADEPRVVMVTNGGKPAWFIQRKAKDRTGRSVAYEDNGFDAKRQRPMKGAYRRYRLETSIRAAVVARMDWQLWQSALQMLADTLRGTLSAYEVLPFRPDRAPWLRQMESL